MIFFFIIFNTTKNISGYILKIIEFLKIDLYKIENELTELIKNIEENDNYLGKINDKLKIIETFSTNDVINNIYIFKALNKIDEKNPFILFKNVNYDSFTIDRFYFLSISSPFEKSFDSLIFEMQTDHIKFTNFANQFSHVEKIYNSIIIKDFENDKKKIIIDNNLIFFTSFFNINNYNFDNFNIEILFINLLKKLINYEILPIKNESFLQIVNPENYTIDFYKELYLLIYPEEKIIFNGYY